MTISPERTHATDTDATQHRAHDHQAGSSVTRPQLTVVTLLTLLALTLAVALPATKVNLALSAEDVGGAVMPPGMVMTRETSAAAMRDMAAVDPDTVTTVAPAHARGDQPLEPQVVGPVKVFDLTTAVTGWTILPGRQVDAYAVNGQVPGPRLRVTEGDRVRIHVHNDLPEPTSLHWHGMVLPNPMDGAADVTQAPIPPGGDHTYEFTARRPGTYFYHSHAAPDRQQALGLYGALLVDPKDPSVDAAYDYDHEAVVQLQEWLTRDGFTFPRWEWKARCRTTSRSTARPTRRPRPSGCGSGRGCGSGSSAHRTTSSTPCTSTAVPSASWQPTVNRCHPPRSSSRTR
jgi:manganese oxidase